MTTRRGGTSDRPRVLHVVDGLGVGGLEILLESLIEHRRDAYDHHICAIRAIGTVGERSARRGTPIHHLGRSEGPDRTVIPRLARLTRRLAPHIVHTHGDGTADALVAARLGGVGGTAHSEHGWLEPRLPPRSLWRGRAFLKMARRVVAVSDHLAHHLQRDLWVPERKIRVIRNAVPEVPTPAKSHRARVRAALTVPDGTQLIGTVGTMRPIKNTPGLIAAFSQLARRRRDVALLLVGDGPQRVEIEADVSRRGLQDSVRMVGQQTAVHDYLAALDVFVLPSHMEGTSLALLEACWCELAIVATAVGGNGEVVESGTTGTLVAPGDSGALAGAIEAYLDDRKRAAAHGAAARERVRSRYSFEEFLDGHDRVYRELLGESPSPR